MPKPELKLSKESIEESIKRTGSAKKAAKELGISYKTIRRRCKRFGIETPVGPNSFTRPKNENAFRKFLRTYKGDPLPIDMREMSKISGIPLKDIRNYLYNLRKTNKALVKAKPWKNHNEIILWTDIKGAKIPDIAFRRVLPYISSNGLIKFVVELQDGNVHVFYYTKDQLKNLYKNKKGSN